MPYIPTVKTIHDAIAAPANQAIASHDADYRAGKREVSYQFTSPGTPTFSAQVKHSFDGVTYFNLGSAITALGITTVNIDAPYWKIDVASLSVAALTIKMG